MPELPEVETVARGLRLTVLGRRILSVTLRKTDFIDDPSLIERHLPGRRIEAVERYGKFMLLRLSAAQGEENSANGDNAPAALLVHLGMTGHIASTAVAQPWEKHTHASFALDDGRELRYTDARRFGRLAYLSAALLPAELEGFGADPLEVTAEEFATRIRSRHSRIKALLLDQTVLRGVGNIYADESLWRAKIHPAKLGASINKKQAAVLHRALQDILKKAIVMRGSSIANFVDGDGEPRRISATSSCLRPRRRKVLPLRNDYPQGHRGGTQQLFLPQVSDWPTRFFSNIVHAKKITAQIGDS